MKNKYFIYIASFIFLLSIGLIIYINHNNNFKVQNYIEDYYAHSDNLSLIHAYPNHPKSQVLSESIGLYMNYLLFIDDYSNFEKQVLILEENFIIKKDNYSFIQWSLDKNVSVNALIDDVRIVNSLLTAANQFNKAEYKDLAYLILASLMKNKSETGFYVDYFDWNYNKAATRITLSYLTPDFFEVLSNTEKNKSLLINSTFNQVFFPEYYDIEKGKYHFSPEVHMIDQLLIALNRENLNTSSPAFENWVITEWKNNHKIAGQYTRNTLKPYVDYESLSVYAYLVKYFDLIDEKDLSKEVQEHAKLIVKNAGLKDAHFFDFILYEQMVQESKPNFLF